MRIIEAFRREKETICNMVGQGTLWGMSSYVILAPVLGLNYTFSNFTQTLGTCVVTAVAEAAVLTILCPNRPWARGKYSVADRVP